ncbi:MAG: hypothetical protein Terrestrivirus1_101 [Terrestrivirus sp.]|uniref:Uncharacterized protein n=1 Tax=Terrestrivirus sp. TaxID=2487775 RepID=A0A3G4ZK68_9VIRU|nr:MAG: hypothetical protein Terrestrivirus1_101 [Terrestrivirus sp.]
MELLDIDKVDRSDFDYCTQIYFNYLKSFQNPNPDGENKYYYQYEGDSNTTYYESLMRHHIITISAQSYEEAMLCNVILRCLFDGHFGGMMCYDEDDEGNQILGLDTNIYFENIKKAETLSQYAGFCRDNPDYPESGRLTIYGSKKMKVFCEKERIYNKDIIINLLNDQFLEEHFDNHKKRINYILSVAL